MMLADVPDSKAHVRHLRAKPGYVLAPIADICIK